LVKKKKNKKAPWLFYVSGSLLLLGLIFLFMLYRWIYANNINDGYKDEYFYVYTESSFDDVLENLEKQDVLKNINSFIWVAKQKNYLNNVKPGKYQIESPSNNNDLVNLLRSGQQIPVQVLIKSFRKKENLSFTLGQILEPDSASFQKVFSDESFLEKYGFKPTTFPALILPNTYEFYWNTSPEQFIARMALEYKNYWNEERKLKAKNLGLSQSEVSTLASIVQSETAKIDEKPKVAGVYLNRLKKRMRLQADPTLIFAHNDYSIKRVLNLHKQIDSPFNTYKYTGLPPGPILIPEISSIDAVLNAETHNFLYFCAKEDFSGYHNFATNYAAHLRNAKTYQQALNKRKIFK